MKWRKMIGVNNKWTGSLRHFVLVFVFFSFSGKLVKMTLKKMLVHLLGLREKQTVMVERRWCSGRNLDVRRYLLMT